MLLSELNEPVMSSTLLLPGEEHRAPMPREIYERLEHSVDLVLDGGNCGHDANIGHRSVQRPRHRGAPRARRCRAFAAAALTA